VTAAAHGFFAAPRRAKDGRGFVRFAKLRVEPIDSQRSRKKRPHQNFRAAQFREEMRRWERRVKTGREDFPFTTVYCIAQGIWQDVEAKKLHR
jgi:hypothetical protein